MLLSTIKRAENDKKGRYTEGVFKYKNWNIFSFSPSRKLKILLFDRDVKTIGKHINNVFLEGELEENRTVAKFATVQKEGTREVEREIEFYNLDVIYFRRLPRQFQVRYTISAMGSPNFVQRRGYRIVDITESLHAVICFAQSI
ncbi:MAG: hypothetical protein U5L45_09895 [Saprospiraceae bacterium]|nr:hypothetical protein [Saprospiraceae bacterium]